MQLPLDQDAIRLYRYALSHLTWNSHRAALELELSQARIESAIATLKQLKLLRRTSDDEDVYLAVAPEVALESLLADEELELRRREAEIAAIRGHVMSLSSYYTEAYQARSGGSVEILDQQMVRHLLRDWSYQVREDVLIAHPGGGWSDEDLASSLKNDLAILMRGVRMRVLLQHATRHHPPTMLWAEKVRAEGAEIRTVPTVPRRLIIHDGQRAVLPCTAQVCDGAAVVQEPAVVDFLVAVHEGMWSHGEPYPSLAGDGLSADHALEIAILRELCTGVKDEVVARRLGMSLRTCRRKIAAIMRALGAENRFQAGVLARAHGLLQDEPAEGDLLPGS